MTINNDELCTLVLDVAGQTYGTATFRRRPLMKAVEARVKEDGWWTSDDDVLSGSAGTKSVGLAKIDWAISHLKERHLLKNPNRNQWRLP